MTPKYKAVIGLEVHVQLATNSKIFCNCSAAFGAEANNHVCPVCLGMPGVLPVLNKTVVEYATKLALATESKINPVSIFARKNYFYPDLPKGYQVSQFDEPFCEFGRVEINVPDEGKRTIALTRIHMEEDAGKSVHAETFVSKDETLVDVNRCGTPLLEIVSEPEFRSGKEAAAYLTTLRQIVRYLGICDGNMEEGSMRCDANISIRPIGQKELGTKTELKNMNSISSVEKAIEYEIERQISVVQDGGTIHQQTLLWDADRNVAEPMRSKEYSHDYRYFPEPDLVPMEISKSYIEEIKKQMPELPATKLARFIKELDLPEYDANVLTEDIDIAQYYETVALGVDDNKEASNWVMGEVLRILKDKQVNISEINISPDYLIQIITLVKSGRISRNIGKKVLAIVEKSGKNPQQIIKDEGLVQISDTGALLETIEKVLQNNPNEVKAFLEGKEKVIGFLMGQVMRETKGKANPKVVSDLMRQKLLNIKP